ncbi:MAG TPA: hypothetical protein VFW09_02555 [Solirubrobacteraceae bacterium]|jgi:DnaJ-class molecular chaperone|nr:hypothetical protein [Solirubrobacteraceae bacterium]
MSATGDPSTCMACRGTGKVLSGLGGTQHEVVCPWCQGTGHRIPGTDAQEHPSEGGAVAAQQSGSDTAPRDGEAIEENAASEDDLT